MEQESPDKLRGMQSHYFILVSIRIISPEEGNLPILHFDDAVIADGNPVGISSKIVKEHLRAVEGRLCVHNPFPAIKVFK